MEVGEMVSRVPDGGRSVYEVPSSLESLGGPAHGVLRLPVTVQGDPGATADLSTRDELVKAYEDLVSTGTHLQQEELLNAAVLRRVWPHLRLPRRCRELWQARFPELALVDGADIEHRHEPPRRRPDHPPPGFHI